MKKKSLVVIAVLATLAMSIGMFAGCAPTSPDKYLDKMNTATVGTTETTVAGVTTKVSVNDDEISFESKVLTFFIVKENKKLVMYINLPVVGWKCIEDSKKIEEVKKDNADKGNAATAKKYSTSKDDYTIADGVWTHKTAKYTIKIEAGKLVIEEPSGLVKVVFNANKPSISAPKEAKDAAKK